MVSKAKASARFVEDGSVASKIKNAELIAKIESTETTLKVSVSSPDMGDTQYLVLTPWLKAGPISDAVARIVARQAIQTKSGPSRREFINCLRYGILRFLTEQHSNYGSLVEKDLTNEVAIKFIAWLTNLKSKGEPLTLETRRHYVGAVRKLSKGLAVELRYTDFSFDIPKNPWPDEENKPKEAKLVPEDQWLKLLKTAIADTRETITEVTEILDKVLDERKKVGVTIVKPSTIEQCICYFEQKYRTAIPERKQLDKNDRRIADSFGYSKMRKAVNPQTNDLAPIIVLLAMFTGMNEQPLCGLLLEDMNRQNILGAEVVGIAPLKNRAGDGGQRIRKSLVIDDEELSPANLIYFVIRWTTILREHAPPHIKNHVFLYANKERSYGHWVRSLGETINGRYMAIPQALGKYSHKIIGTYVAFRALRDIFSELMDGLLDGDRGALKILLGHTSITTTDGHYRAEQARKRDELALAGGMAIRERLITSNGQVDPRSGPKTGDRSAATPGWSCLAPFRSPIPGQEQGKLCAAYGQCPGCWLGAPICNEPEALARMLQLREKFREAKEYLGIAIWKSKYLNASQALEDIHIPRLATSENVAIARALDLNPIPRLR